MINQIRRQTGGTPVKVIANSLAFGNKFIKEGYNDPNWDVFGSNMYSGKRRNNDYRNSLNVLSTENVGGSLQSWTVMNDGSLTKAPIPTQTMDSLKETIYNTVRSMMFADGTSGWGHAANFTSYGSELNNLTLGFDKYGYTHFVFFEADEGNENLTDNPYTIPSNTDLIVELNNAKQNQSAKQTTANDAKSANDKAQAALNDATTQLASAESALNQSKTAQESAQQAINNMSADLKTKQQAVAKAAQELNDAKTALSKAQTSLFVQEARVSSAKQNNLLPMLRRQLMMLMPMQRK